MKFSIQLILLLIPVSIFGNFTFVEIESDSCSPVYATIYDFDVNDIFQYRSRSTSSAGGSSPTYDKVTQYIVTNKESDSLTTSYTIDGWALDLFYYNESGNSNNLYDTTSDYTFLYEIVTYTDTSNNMLNQCPKELIKVDYQMFEELGIGDVYSQVLVYKYDSTRLVKKIGGENNLFVYDEQNQLTLLNDITFEAVYCPGLGLLSQEFTFFEMHESIQLEAYVKSYDTVGTLLSNSQYVHATKNHINKPESVLKNIIYPNPGTGKISFNSDNITEIAVYNLLGKLVYQKDYEINAIDLKHLSAGTYIIHIKQQDGHVIRKQYVLY